MNAISDTQQPAQLKGTWRVLQALANTGGDSEAYAQYLLWMVGRVLAQLPDSLHAQTRKRHAVFQWAMRSGAELEKLLKSHQHLVLTVRARTRKSGALR